MWAWDEAAPPLPAVRTTPLCYTRRKLRDTRRVRNISPGARQPPAQPAMPMESGQLPSASRVSAQDVSSSGQPATSGSSSAVAQPAPSPPDISAHTARAAAVPGSRRSTRAHTNGTETGKENLAPDKKRKVSTTLGSSGILATPPVSGQGKKLKASTFRGSFSMNGNQSEDSSASSTQPC